MDSRLIFESSKWAKMTWTRKKNSESEWIYFDSEKPELIKNIIKEFFLSNSLHVALGRKDSYSDSKDSILIKVMPLIGKTDFKIWNESFTKAGLNHLV